MERRKTCREKGGSKLTKKHKRKNFSIPKNSTKEKMGKGKKGRNGYNEHFAKVGKRKVVTTFIMKKKRGRGIFREGWREEQGEFPTL